MWNPINAGSRHILMSKLASLLLALGLVAAACGAETSPAGTDSPSASSTSSAPTTVEAAPGEGESTSTVAEDDYGLRDEPDDEDDYGFRDADDETTTTVEGDGDVTRDDRPPTSKLPEKVDTGQAAPVVEDVPAAMMDGILAHASNLLGVATAEISTVRAQRVVWNDGSLGCPLPGVFYTQATVDGYWVVVEYGGTEYDYRVGKNDIFRLCESPGAAPPGTPDS